MYILHDVHERRLPVDNVEQEAVLGRASVFPDLDHDLVELGHFGEPPRVHLDRAVGKVQRACHVQ